VADWRNELRRHTTLLCYGIGSQKERA